MKIINRKRFYTFIGVVFLILTLLGSIAVSAISNVSAEKSEKRVFSNKELEFINSFEKVEVSIFEGDTSWSIQSELAPNTDVRKLLYYIDIINDKNMGYIKPGDTLVFLKEVNN